VISGLSPDGELVEIVELRDHPWFLGCQFHPEFNPRRGDRTRCSRRSLRPPSGTVNRGTNRDQRDQDRKCHDRWRSPLALIAGPCVIESEASTLAAAERLKVIAADLGIALIFKSSYDKANRSSVTSYRGPGITEGLRILARVKQELGLPVLSDIHRFEEIARPARSST